MYTFLLKLTLLTGPPRRFVADLIFQTNISFAWDPPLTPGALISYVLSCQATVTGINDPLAMNTTKESAVLVSLSPGVPYSCSLTAFTDTNMPPPAMLTVTTTESGIIIIHINVNHKGIYQ